MPSILEEQQQKPNKNKKTKVGFSLCSYHLKLILLSHLLVGNYALGIWICHRQFGGDYKHFLIVYEFCCDSG
jgi:hypothetical protein